MSVERKVVGAVQPLAVKGIRTHLDCVPSRDLDAHNASMLALARGEEALTVKHQPIRLPRGLEEVARGAIRREGDDAAVGNVAPKA